MSVVALRGLTNERGEFLITTLPVMDLTVSTSSTGSTLPHFASGNGWTTQVVLVNPTDAAISGSIQFSGPAGQDATVTANGIISSSFLYSIPRRGSFKLTTATGAAFASGAVHVVPSFGSVAPGSLVIFSFRPANVTVSEAGVPSSEGTAFRMYVEASGIANTVGSIQSGIALANPTAVTATVSVELTTMDGISTGRIATLNIPPNGQIAKFLNEIYPDMPLPFAGLLRITTTSSRLAVVGLRSRYNERGDFLITTTPPANESVPVTNAELDFPHIINGTGLTTQIVLFSGATAQSSPAAFSFFLPTENL